MRDGMLGAIDITPRTNGTESGLWQRQWQTMRWIEVQTEQQGRAEAFAEVNYGQHRQCAGNHNRKGASKTSGDGLATAVAMWPPQGNGRDEGRAKDQRGQGI